MIVLDPPRRLLASTDPWDELRLSRPALVRFLARARKAVGLRGAVDVLLAGDGALRRLNREFRGKDKATDVLSFPSPEEIFEERAGDLAISYKTAERQAKAFGHGLEDEVRILMLHGLLHLSGMDHETDRGEMAAREAELRGVLRLPVGLIARVRGSVGEKHILFEDDNKKSERRALRTPRTRRNATRVRVGEKQILFEDDNKKSKSERRALRTPRTRRDATRVGVGKKQILFEDDNKKSKGKSESNGDGTSKSMTTTRVRARVRRRV